MMGIKEYIESGLLELYVLGNATKKQSAEVEKMASAYPEIAAEIEIICEALNKYAQLIAVVPNPVVKPFLMAVIDYSERIKNGEEISFPPVLTQNSSVEDYGNWLNRTDMCTPVDLSDVYAKIIGNTDTVITAIVWIKELAPQEVHHNEIEKFLIVEGSCDIVIDNEIHQLIAGDFLSIPLYKNHFVRVTSTIPCKVILQRIAA